jgi:hypothetical protein
VGRLAPVVWQAATRDMNAMVPQRYIDARVADDPARAAAEYGAQFCDRHRELCQPRDYRRRRGDRPVVEHVDERFLDNLLLTLCSGRVILMTHATPGQDGYHHVNEKPDRYWIEQLPRRGYNLLPEDTKRIRVMAQNDGAAYMNATGLLFHKEEISDAEIFLYASSLLSNLAAERLPASL